MLESLQEDDILERLNQQLDIHGLLVTAMDIIGQNVDQLIMKAFRKDKHAIKFVIPSLVGNRGPLNELSVRLKLLYALGVISREEYEDIELIMAIVDELELDDETVYTFVDDEILGPISLLHDMTLPPQIISQKIIPNEAGIVDSIKSSIYKQRYQQMIRSALIIAITTLVVRLSEKQCLLFMHQ
ncbi:MltR family transcriptional regulator [Orbus sturtevantii]|uniref:MltR family transcriptional regulator n=1 Tax=Orbus sturtevantii TaxID=3074109 RepID=UPI00370DAD72